MMTTNQLPPLPVPKFTETIRGVPCITVTEHEHLMREYALQARAQVQGEACPTCGETEPYTGSCGTSNNDTKALCKQPAQATQAEVTDERDELLGVVAALGSALRRLTFAARTSGGTAGPDAELMVACEHAEQAITLRGIVDALRPERAPMTDLPEGDVTYFDGRGDAVDGYTAERVWEILRSHGINAQAKKEGAA